MNTRFSEIFSVSFRHSTISQLSQDSPSVTHLLSFIKSVFDQLQVDENKDYLKKDGTFLLVAGRFFENPEGVGCHPVVNFEKVKLLQQSAAGLSVGQIDHIKLFSLLPGRVDIRLSIDNPTDNELVEPLQESCIWCQARGAATEVSMVERVAGSSEKVGIAQQWYEELDNLAFSTPESELVIKDDNATTDTNSEDERIHIDCAVNTSPGTSEVIVYAALYLKLRRNHVLQDDNNQEKFAARIANILNPERNERSNGNSCTKFLLKSKRDLRDLIFIKPLHVRIKFNTQNHPTADNSKDIILTDSSLNIDVSLN